MVFRPLTLCFITPRPPAWLFPAVLSQWALLRLPLKVCMVCLVNSSRGPTSLGDMDDERGPVRWKEIHLNILLLLFFIFILQEQTPAIDAVYLHALPHFSIPSTPLSWRSVISCCVCSDFTCMWPLHIPVNNHTLQHGYWFVPVDLTRSFSPIHWLSRNTWRKRNWHLDGPVSIWSEQNLTALRCGGTASSSTPATTPSPPPPTMSLQQGDLLTCMGVCLVCLCVCVFLGCL